VICVTVRAVNSEVATLRLLVDLFFTPFTPSDWFWSTDPGGRCASGMRSFCFDCLAGIGLLRCPFLKNDGNCWVFVLRPDEDRSLTDRCIFCFRLWTFAGWGFSIWIQLLFHSQFHVYPGAHLAWKNGSVAEGQLLISLFSVKLHFLLRLEIDWWILQFCQSSETQVVTSSLIN